MALIECKKCGAKISDKATVCPKCGSLNKPNSAVRPKHSSLNKSNSLTLLLDSKERNYKILSWAFLLTTIVCVICHGWYYNTFDLYFYGIAIHSFGLVVLVSIVVAFNLALNKLTRFLKKTVLSTLLVASVCSICLILVNPPFWLFGNEQLALICSWVLRIGTMISFAILAIKCKGWAIKLAFVVMIVSRVWTIINICIGSNLELLPYEYMVFDFFKDSILYLVSAIFFVLSTRTVYKELD